MVRLDDRHIEELYTRLRETDSRVRRVEESLAGTLARLAAVGAGVEALTASCGVRPPCSLRLFLLALLLALLLEQLPDQLDAASYGEAWAPRGCVYWPATPLLCAASAGRFVTGGCTGFIF